MDVDFTEDQRMLRTMARDFLEKECPTTPTVREIEDSEIQHSPELWNKMAELGWMGLVIPSEYGGAGGSFLDMTSLLEEIGRGALPSPFLDTVVIGVFSIIAAGTEEQKQEFLPQIAKGKMVLAFALTEPSAGWDAASIAVRAVAQNDEYVINGTKLFVEYAHVADYLLCVVKTGDGENPEDGISLFLVDAKSPGITCTPFRTAGVLQCEVAFDNVRVPAKNMLGKRDQGWLTVQKLLEYAAIAKCAEMIGGARRAVEMTVSYAKERVAYEKVIGSYQVVQHTCVEMLQSVETAAYITYETAWRLSEGLPCTRQVAAAKAYTSEAYKQVTQLGAHFHGAIGFMRDHDMGLYFRRARAAELAFGDIDYQREFVARELGL